MKFESGLEQKDRDERKAKGERLKGFEAYKDFNGQAKDKIVEKRRNENDEFAKRQEGRIKKLEDMEKNGVIYINE